MTADQSAPQSAKPQGAPVPGTPHSCEHCATAGAGHGAAPDPTARAASHLALAGRRLAPRITLGVLGLGAALVLAQRSEVSLGVTALLFVGAALSWLVAAWGGVVLGELLARDRGPRARLALGQVLAAALGALTALGLASVLSIAARQSSATQDLTAHLVLPGAVAAASGWFLAAAIAELVRVRALRGRIARQDETGATARDLADGLTPSSIRQAETVSLVVAVAYGVATALLAAVPLLAVVLVPLAAAGAAWWGLRANQPREAS